MIKIKAYYQFIFKLDLSKYKVNDEEGIEIVSFDNEKDYSEFLSINHLTEHTLAEGTKVLVFVEKDAVYGKCL